MERLKDLYIEEILNLYKIDISKSKLSDSFFDNYYHSTKPFQDLFNDTFRVFKVSSSIKTKNNSLARFLTSYLNENEITKLLETYKDLVENDFLEKNENKIIFKVDKTFYNQELEKGFNVRKGQNISKFLLPYFDNLDILVETKYLLRNNLDQIIDYIRKDFESLYLRIGIEPKDYFRMGQWGYDRNRDQGFTSCTFIDSDRSGRIENSIFFSENSYKRAIITYMQMPTFVATLYDNEEEAINRNYTALARQIFYYDDNISSLLGLRGYGPLINIQTIRENIAKIMSEQKKIKYSDYLLENRTEGKKRRNIFPKNIGSYRDSIANKYNIHLNDDGYLGYLDTLNFNKWAKHTLIHSQSQINLFDYINNDDNEELLLESEAKEIKKSCEQLFKSFITITGENNSSRFVHPCLTPEFNNDKTINWINKPVEEYNMVKSDYFFASKLINETILYKVSEYDTSIGILDKLLFTNNYSDGEKRFTTQFLDNEKIRLIKEKTAFDFSDAFTRHKYNDSIINIMER